MFATLLLASLTVAADPPKEKGFSPEAEKELKRLEGKWMFVKGLSKDGESEMKDLGAYAVYEGTLITFYSEKTGKKEMLEITAIDPSTDPKCIDLVEKRKGRPDRTVEGVYKIDGDTMLIAIAVPFGGKVRPVSFEKPKDPRVVVWTLKRVKE